MNLWVRAGAAEDPVWLEVLVVSVLYFPLLPIRVFVCRLERRQATYLGWLAWRDLMRAVGWRRTGLLFVRTFATTLALASMLAGWRRLAENFGERALG